MRYVKFKEKINNRIDKKILNLEKSKIYDRIKELKNKTKDINYGCDFDENDICNKYKKWGLMFNKIHPKCCCSLCSVNIGYLDDIQNDKDLRYYAKLFHPINGFWRKDKGCILDRSMRSRTCLFHFCANSNMSKELNKLRLIGREIIKLYNQLTTNV